MPQTWTHRYQNEKGKWVFVPSDAARTQGALIVNQIKSQWTPPDYFYHLRKGGHVSALKQHLSSDWFIKADIQGFFESINKSRATRMLQRFFPQYTQARENAAWCVVPNPAYSEESHTHGAFILPYGFIQSPLLASVTLHFSALGTYLGRLNAIQDIRLSVYMDDIIISGPTTIDGEEIMEQLKTKADRSRFTLHPAKTTGPACCIDAFNITLAQGRLAINEKRLEEFRNKLVQNPNPYIFRGIQTYIASVNREQLL